MAGVRSRRMNKLVQPKRKDSYESFGKSPERTVCTECGLVYREGRWQWAESVTMAHAAKCPACQRVAHGYPAGFVELSGRFFEQHRQDILNLVRNEGQLESSERPLERIMDIRDEEGRTVVTTTGVHTARRIGEAISRAYHGEFSFHYGDSDRNIRVSWTR